MFASACLLTTSVIEEPVFFLRVVQKIPIGVTISEIVLSSNSISRAIFCTKKEAFPSCFKITLRFIFLVYLGKTYEYLDFKYKDQVCRVKSIFYLPKKYALFRLLCLYMTRDYWVQIRN